MMGGVKVLNSLGYFDGKSMDKIGRIKIGDNCFIGSRSIILMNVIVGDNVIIGAGSVVSKDIPSNSVAAGIPAKVICTVDEYYAKNKAKGAFYETGGLTAKQKRTFFEQNPIAD